MRLAARRDSNEIEIVALARMLGAHMVKAGPLDYLACIRGKWSLVEIKRPERKGHKNEYTDAQLRFFSQCRMNGSPWLIWRTQDDVLAYARSK